MTEIIWTESGDKSGFVKKRHTLRVFLLWILVSGFFLTTMLFAYPKVSEMLILSAGKNVYPYTERLIKEGKAIQAATLLETMIGFSYEYVGEGDTRFRRVGDAWKEAGNTNKRTYWEARALYHDSYWKNRSLSLEHVLSATEATEIWSGTLEAARKLPVLDRVGNQSLEKTGIENYFQGSFRTMFWGRPLFGGTLEWTKGLSQVDRTALLVASGDLDLNLDGKIGETDLTVSFPIEVYSKGNQFMKGAVIKVAGKAVLDVGFSEPGFCAVVVSPDTGETLDTKVFDTARDASEWRKMLSWAKEVRPGSIIAAAVSGTAGANDDAVDQFTLRQFLAEFGVQLPMRNYAVKKLIADQAFAGLGVKGAKPGTGVRVLGEYARGEAMIVVMGVDSRQ